MCDFTPEASLIPGTASQRKSQYHKIDLLLFLNPIYPQFSIPQLQPFNLPQSHEIARWSEVVSFSSRIIGSLYLSPSSLLQIHTCPPLSLNLLK